jgi:hypothetical protein
MSNFALPNKLITELVEIAHTTEDRGLTSMIINGCKWFMDMNDYNDFRNTLKMLEAEYPNLINFKKALSQVKRSETKFNNL